MATLQKQLLLATIVALFSLPIEAATTKLCRNAESAWTAQDVEDCDSSAVVVDRNGIGTLDLTGWTENNFKTVFEVNEKVISGGIMIDGSNLATIEMTLEPENNGNITVTNCMNLQYLDLGLSVREGYAVPILHIGGNRKLLESAIDMLRAMITEDHIVSNESYIQVVNECKLQDPNGTVNNAVNDLAGCKAIYGDFRITAQTVLPTDLTQIGQLSYIQGCLEISGTNIARLDDLTFLTETTSKRGGCKSQHKIVNNPKMCIQPPQSKELQRRFPNMSISGNENCEGECRSDYLFHFKDPNCKIITDSLLITDHAGTNLAYLRSVKEIKGTLNIARTEIEHFNFLDNLEKLNTDNITTGVVFSLKNNHNLKTFDLPKLTAIPVTKDQFAVYEDSNGEFKLAESFFTRMGVKKNDSVQRTAPLTTTTAAPTTTTEASMVQGLIEKLVPENAKLSDVQILVVTIDVFVLLVAILILLRFFNVFSLFAKVSGQWEYEDIDVKKIPEPIGPIIHCVEKDFMSNAKKRIDDNASIIKALDELYTKNTKCNIFTVSNGDAPGFFATPEEKEDFDKHNDNREGKAYPLSTMHLPAQIDDQYGIRFIEQAKTTDDVQYRTQCDAVGYAWNACNIPPVYTETFAKTAERMVHLAAVRLSDGLRIMGNADEEVAEFGIDFSTVQKILNNSNSVRNSSHLWKSRVFYPHWAKYQFHRYRSHFDAFYAPRNSYKFHNKGNQNYAPFIERMVIFLLNMPKGQQLQLKKAEVVRVLNLAFPLTLRKVHRITLKPLNDQASGSYSVNMNKRHVRIVGETRGDFDALRKALSIPSIIKGDGHSIMQYNWVFLGNYVSGHPQSLETILLLLGLQHLFGSDSVVLLRGALEFEEMNKEYGFKKLLKDRFGSKGGTSLWGKFNKIFATFPLNCDICERICCTSGGFSEADIKGNFRTKDECLQKKCVVDSTNYNKVFSLPNYTVKHFFDNVESCAGYYYGERLMGRINAKTALVASFTTAPMECGLGIFGDTMPCRLFALSSVRGLQGHGGQTTDMAVIAEVNAETEHITFHAILESNETFAYDRKGTIYMNEQEANEAKVHEHVVSTAMVPSTEQIGSKNNYDNGDDNPAPSKEPLDKGKGAKTPDKKTKSTEELAKARSKDPKDTKNKESLAKSQDVVTDRTKSKEVLSQTKSKENFSKSKEAH